MDNSFLSTEPFLKGKPLEAWLDIVGIKDWSMNDAGLVDVARDVDLESKLGELKRLPVRFGNVGGNFICHKNRLVSLDGAPKEVGGTFRCSYNQLVSLERAPNKVGSSFDCEYNQLVSLVGAPKQIGGSFDCSKNQLVSLEGAPKEVGGEFACWNNQLVSLEGAPKEVGRTFWCDHNLLVDFKGLEGVRIGGDLTVTDSTTYGQDNVFVSLEGLPKALYSKVLGLDILFVQELAKKRTASLLDAEVAELSSEVELG